MHIGDLNGDAYPDLVVIHQGYSAGTGGSVLVIGSAAGVVAMGMEKIEFFWYLKNIGWLAFLGFASGFLTFVLIEAYILI